MDNQERTSPFLAVTCKCGRGLRAKVELAGSEIRCWDCHKMVQVPVPDRSFRVARELSDGAMVVIKGPGLNTALIAATLVTGCLAIPVVGTWCSVMVLTLGASAYGEIIRRVSGGDVNAPAANWWLTRFPRSIVKIALCLILSAGTVVPLWILNGGEHQSPHWNRLGIAIAAATWLILPWLMLSVYGQKYEEDRLGLRGALRVLLKHPVAASLALAMIPSTLILLEVGLGLIFYVSNSLPFFALEFMPMPRTLSEPRILQGVPVFKSFDFREFGPKPWIAGYFDGLKHGYSFVGAIPPSLANATNAELDAGDIIHVHDKVYFAMRLLIAMVIVTCLMTAFAIQARWLGSLAALDGARPVPRDKELSPPPGPAPST